mmetsp:Transcript_50751/g.163195  ORF Transcript_50751/g.163195 Transcript_50751/m.163195 type:complete len:242 (+) Transcript_50751:187-912(+)
MNGSRPVDRTRANFREHRPPQSSTLQGQRRLPERAVQREENADGGRPVEPAAADAHKEAGRAVLCEDRLCHAERALLVCTVRDRPRAAALARAAPAASLPAPRHDARRHHVRRRRDDGADQAADGAKGSLGGQPVEGAEGGARDEVRLEQLEDGDLHSAHRHVAQQRRRPRRQRARAALAREQDLPQRVSRRRGKARLEARLGRLGGRADQRADELARGAGEQVGEQGRRREPSLQQQPLG